jgi:dTDP-glucose 4,6-dehydratase
VTNEQNLVEARGEVERVEVSAGEALLLGHFDTERLAGEARSVTRAHARAAQAELRLDAQRGERRTGLTRLTLALLGQPPLEVDLAVLGVTMAQEPDHGKKTLGRGLVIVCNAMATCLVTGGSGFLGSHLCDHLIAKGYRVVCVDNFETGNLNNIAHIKDGDHFRFVQADITEHYEIDEPLDFVYHMASPASPIDYARLPLHTLKVGAYGTHNTLGLAKAKRARFLLASTSEVYGDPEVHPQKETYWGNVNPIGPRGVYDEAKRYAEAMTMAYLRQQGVDTGIVRIFNTFGSRMRPHDGRAIPTFLRQALSEKPVTVFGDGSQTRSFCYVDDLVRGLIMLTESGVHEPVNLGNPNEMTLLEMAKLVIELTESRSEIVFEALPIDDPKVRQPDISRAKDLLGWEPQVDLREGLTKTIDQMMKELARPA